MYQLLYMPKTICLCKYYIWKVFIDNVFDEWHVAYDER